MSEVNGCGAGPFPTLNTKEQKIVGGTEAIKNSWPFIASLLQCKADGNEFKIFYIHLFIFLFVCFYSTIAYRQF